MRKSPKKSVTFITTFCKKTQKTNTAKCAFFENSYLRITGTNFVVNGAQKKLVRQVPKTKKRVLTEVRKNWCALKRAICTKVQKKLRIWRTSIFCGQMRNFSAPRCANFCFKKFSKKISSPYQREIFLMYAVKCHFSVSVKTLKIEF